MICLRHKDAVELGKDAARLAALKINAAIADQGSARIILSTGASQFETLEELVKKDIDWSKVEMFHLDEYVNLPETHPASFRRYLKERFVNLVNLKKAYFVDGQSKQSLTLNALFSDENMLNLESEAVAGTIYTQNLITLTAGIRYMGAITSTNLILNNISQLDALGYTNVGYITSADKLEKGQYGLVYTNSGMTLAAAAIPEPTTATLSLLALAGLAARRRRR